MRYQELSYRVASAGMVLYVFALSLALMISFALGLLLYVHRPAARYSGSPTAFVSYIADQSWPEQ